EKLRREGYRPWDYESGFISGVVLERGDGEFRFVVTDGTHRLAALSVSGEARVLMRTAAAPIREQEVGQWPAVAAGLCSREDALAYFDAYFELDGRERAEALGLSLGVAE